MGDIKPSENKVVDETSKLDMGKMLSSAPPSQNRTSIIVGLILLVVLCIGIYIAINPISDKVNKNKNSAISQSALVLIKNNQFVPATINVKTNETVQWINQDSTTHLIASDPFPKDNKVPGFKSTQYMNYNDRYSFTFNKAGTYTYHDDLNPVSLKGTVIVTN